MTCKCKYFILKWIMKSNTESQLQSSTTFDFYDGVQDIKWLSKIWKFAFCDGGKNATCLATSKEKTFFKVTTNDTCGVAGAEFCETTLVLCAARSFFFLSTRFCWFSFYFHFLVEPEFSQFFFLFSFKSISARNHLPIDKNEQRLSLSSLLRTTFADFSLSFLLAKYATIDISISIAIVIRPKLCKRSHICSSSLKLWATTIIIKIVSYISRWWEIHTTKCKNIT